MTSKHTPAPWKAHATELARSGLPEFEIHYSDIGECVAEVVHGEANANLIAAAPDLLEQAEKALAWFLKLEDWSGVGDPDIDGLRTAINKARG